jgi:hypothetical protein
MPAKTAFFAEWHRFAPIFPTADASPTFGMTRKKVSSRIPRLASRVIPRSVSDEGSAVENTDGRMA